MHFDNAVVISKVHLQEYGLSQEYSFTTAPAPGSDTPVSLMAVADMGFCEGDGAMTWSGNYPNPIEVEPPGTEAEIKTEVRLWRQTTPRLGNRTLLQMHHATCKLVKAP